MLRPLIVSILAITSLSNTLADTEFEDTIPLELAKIFLGNSPSNEVRIYSDILDAFPNFQLPSGFSVLGSIDQGYTKRVVLRTTFDVDVATSALVSAFEIEGFVTHNPGYPMRLDVGFVTQVQSQRQRPTGMCKDDVGVLYYSVITTPLGNLASINISSAGQIPPQTCADSLAQQMASFSMMQQRNTGIRQYLPRMEVPEPDRRMLRTSIGGGSRGSNNSIEADHQLNIDWSLEEVYRHLADQILAQGWTLDNESIGGISANGDWTISPTADLHLAGNLNVLEIGESFYQLKFRLVAVGGQQPAVGILRSF